MSDWAGFWIGAGIAALGFFIAVAVDSFCDSWERIDREDEP